MYWHVVKIEFKPEVQEERLRWEASLLEYLTTSDRVAFARISHSIDNELGTLVMSGFATKEDLDHYFVDPPRCVIHEVVQALKTSGGGAIDVWTDDPPDALARSL